MSKSNLSFLFSLLLTLHLPTAFAIEYPLPTGESRVLGELTYHTVKKDEHFQSIAQHYNVGFLALMAANPGIDPLLPDPGTELVIPTQLILPYAKQEGILINLSELRLYFFDKKNNTVNVFPIGIGKIGQSTPLFTDKITEKRKNPNWFPTENKRAEHLAETGEVLPKMVKAGPDNPLGDYAMRIGYSVYLIHGTNQRFGIGMRASGGCIRMNPEDIEWLFNNTPIGTRVRVIDQPIKMTYVTPQKRMIEVHSPLTRNNGDKPELWPLPKNVEKFIGSDPKELEQVFQLIEKSNGLPVVLDSLEAP
ncbi:L,D-transpeptidase family protein [Thalassotalea aquiviva]|uniref:L,D-transpeptidase family protein n=1 Tax=Thalassotalea aquiviva TaxID=3242415 RepID=UPI00352B9606